MIKFIHAADIHLDSPMRGLERYEGAPVEACRGAARRALENLVKLAVEEKVGVVLIVGDLYDGDWPDYNTGLFFGAQMARLRDAGIKVVLIRGNHDAENRMTKDLRLLDNAVVLDHNRPQSIAFDDLGLAVHGQSFPTRAVIENLARNYPSHIPGLFNIGLLHTAVEGREGHERYAPCSLDDMRFRGYQYWALGHIHKREMLAKVDPVIAFPGNVQGRSVREVGPKGCLLVTVDDSLEVTVELRCLDVMRWDVLRLDAGGSLDGDDVLGRFRERLDNQHLPELDDRLLALRVELQGPTEAHADLASDWPYWTNEIRQTAAETSSGRVWVEKVISRTSPPSAAVPLLDDGPLAELAALLEELKQDEGLLKELFDRELDDLRKKLDPKLLEDLDAPGHSRELLDQVGPMLMSRLRGGPLAHASA